MSNKGVDCLSFSVSEDELVSVPSLVTSLCLVTCPHFASSRIPVRLYDSRRGHVLLRMDCDESPYLTDSDKCQSYHFATSYDSLFWISQRH